MAAKLNFLDLMKNCLKYSNKFHIYKNNVQHASEFNPEN